MDFIGKGKDELKNSPDGLFFLTLSDLSASINALAQVDRTYIISSYLYSLPGLVVCAFNLQDTFFIQFIRLLLLQSIFILL